MDKLYYFIPLTGIIITLIFHYFQKVKEYKWKKAEFTYRLLRMWIENYKEERYFLEELGEQGIFGHIISIETNNIDEKKLKRIKKTTRDVMNYFEDLATYYFLDMVNKKVVHEKMENMFVRYVVLIRKLVDSLDNESGYPSWKRSKQLFNDWSKSVQQDIPAQKF